MVVATIALSAAALSGALLSAGVHAGSTSTSASFPTAKSTHSAAAIAPSTNARTLTAPGPAAAAKLEAEMRAAHLDPRTFYPPNMLYAPTMQKGLIVKPSYPEAPEPAGLADYGVNNSTGTPTSYTIDTTGYRATVTLNSVNPYYLANYNPEAFTSQLNVVLQNVTVFGNSSYNFWTQDVFFYDAYSDQLLLLDNIWNFSSTTFLQPANTFLKIPGYTNGTPVVIPGENYYYTELGPFNGIRPPFTVELNLNATTLEYNGTNYTEANFAIDVLNGTGATLVNDQFDRALFNNTGGSGAIPQAHFHIDGTNITPTGYIPYDAEIMLGGPGGGSTATFQGINGSMTLQHTNSTGVYVNEPATWSSGSETGETCVGVAEYYTSDDVVHLGAGPEFIQPFWNSSATATPGAATLSGTITPSNSWAFVTNGASYNISNSAWGAVPVSGAYSWNLTQGTYTVKIMESDYNVSMSGPLALTAGTTTPYSVAMVANTTMGVYTPLYAMSNSQLAAISSGGTGTVADPYMILNNEVSNLSGEFASMNDYGFPAYPGISLVGTTDYVEISDAAPFLVDFWGTSLNVANHFFMPGSNDLNIWMFETTHVSVVGGTISGWFGPYQTGFPFALVLIWNSTGDLVTGVTFEVSVDGVQSYGSTGDSIVGNTFLYAPQTGYVIGGPVVYTTSFPYGVELPATGLIVSDVADSIWNNYFDTPFTAVEPNVNPYDDFYPAGLFSYTNNWNLTAPIPAGTTTVINGISITGAVGGFPYACGNWWYDYTPGVTSLPYDELAYGFVWITTGGDYCPAGSLGTLLFVESGLPTGTSWSVKAGTMTLSGTTASLQTTVPTGMYDYTVGTVTGYAPSVASGSANVTWLGGVTTVSITFSSTAPTTGTLMGTVTPTTATVQIDGTATTVTAGAFSATVSVGTHSVEATATGYYTYYNNVTVASGGTSTVTIVLNPITLPPGPDGSLNLTVTPTTATVLVNGVAVTLTAGAYSHAEAPGVYSVVATASGYYGYYNNITVVSSTASMVAIALNPVTPPVGPDGTLSLTVTPSSATVYVDGTAVTLSSGTYSASMTPGVHSIEVTASGYYAYYNNVTVKSSTTTSVPISLNVVSTTTTSSGYGGVSNTGWILIAVLALLVVIFLITTVIYMSRSRGGSGGQTSEGTGQSPGGGDSS